MLVSRSRRELAVENLLLRKQFSLFQERKVTSHRLTFIQNHARVMVACDFFVVITAAFRTLYVFIVIEIGSRQILHHNATAHPTAEWTLQQFREALPGGHPYRFAVHDRDRIFSEAVDQGLTDHGVRVLRTRVRAPKANSVCERLGGSLPRECLDFLIPFNEHHLQLTVRDWAIHYNRGRPIRHRTRSA